MRDRYIITITGCKGARHFTLSQLMRRTLLGLSAVLALSVLCGASVIYLLNGKVGQLRSHIAGLQTDQQQITTANRQLLAEQQRLKSAVQVKTEELVRLSDELDQIEVLIGVKPEPALGLAQRIDTASQTALEKRTMLESIPSGFPLRDSRITSRYGMRLHPVRDEEAFHGGADLKAQRGTPVYASADGVVEWAGVQQSSGLGKMVKLAHNYGFSSIYGHLDRIDVKTGQYIRKGDLLGLSGSTGVTSGPHLHYEVRYLQRRLDPAPFLGWSLDRYDTLFAKEERVQWESLAEALRRTTAVQERLLSQQGPSWSAASP